MEAVVAAQSCPTALVVLDSDISKQDDEIISELEQCTNSEDSNVVIDVEVTSSTSDGGVHFGIDLSYDDTDTIDEYTYATVRGEEQCLSEELSTYISQDDAHVPIADSRCNAVIRNHEKKTTEEDDDRAKVTTSRELTTHGSKNMTDTIVIDTEDNVYTSDDDNFTIIRIEELLDKDVTSRTEKDKEVTMDNKFNTSERNGTHDIIIDESAKVFEGKSSVDCELAKNTHGPGEKQWTGVIYPVIEDVEQDIPDHKETSVYSLIQVAEVSMSRKPVEERAEVSMSRKTVEERTEGNREVNTENEYEWDDTCMSNRISSTIINESAMVSEEKSFVGCHTAEKEREPHIKQRTGSISPVIESIKEDAFEHQETISSCFRIQDVSHKDVEERTQEDDEVEMENEFNTCNSNGTCDTITDQDVDIIEENSIDCSSTTDIYDSYSKEATGSIFPVIEDVKQEAFDEKGAPNLYIPTEEVVCNDFKQPTDEGREEGMINTRFSSKCDVITDEVLEVSDGTLSIGHQFTKEEHIPHNKQWTGSAFSVIRKDKEVSYHEKSAYSFALKRDFKLNENQNVTYNDEVTMTKDNNNSGKRRHRDAQEILKELQKLKSAAYSLDMVYRNMQIEVKYIKKFLKDEIDLINRQSKCYRLRRV